MKVLVACEFSGVVREAFRKKGHNAWSIDFLSPMDYSEYHYQDNVLDYINRDWDLMIAFPPCTHLCVSGARWFKNKEKETILLALNHYNGHRTDTATVLGISMRTLRNKLHKYRADGTEIIASPSRKTKD